MSARKTIQVEQLREWVNTRLAAKDSVYFGIGEMSPEQAFRLGVASLLEQVLQATDNYRGFLYTDGHEKLMANDYDPTRRVYLGDRRETFNRA